MLITLSLLILGDPLSFSNIITIIVFHLSNFCVMLMITCVKDMKVCHIVLENTLIGEFDSVLSGDRKDL